MATTIRPLTVALEGQPVQVYRNLKNGLFSILHRGRVVAHVETVNLLNVTFKVRPGGRERVLRERCKNVHAFAIGTYTEAQTTGTEAVTYCPYTAPHFYHKKGLQPVFAASTARLTAGQAYVPAEPPTLF